MGRGEKGGEQCGGCGDEREQWISFKAYPIHYWRKKKKKEKRKITAPTYK